MVILSNVLSPQYFVWAFPLLLLLAVEIMPEGQVRPWLLGALLVAVAVTTTWIFPYNYFCNEANPYALVPMHPNEPLVPSLIVYQILALRNFIYLGVVLWLGVMLFKRINHLSTLSKA